MSSKMASRKKTTTRATKKKNKATATTKKRVKRPPLKMDPVNVRRRGLYAARIAGNNPKVRGNKKIGGRKSKFTPERIDRFLDIVANNGGIVSDACRDIGFTRQAVYIYRQKHPDFDRRFQEAQDRGIDVIEEEAKHRATYGTEQPIYYQGKIVGTVRQKSDTCMGLVLRAHRANYRKTSQEITGPDGESLFSNVKIVMPDNQRATTTSDESESESETTK